MAKRVSWFLRIVVAVIFLRIVVAKLIGAPGPVHLFETLGMEPWGRFGTAIAELVATVLLLVPRTKVYGALAALALMVGAIGSHLTKLGIEVGGDGGLLFGMAVVVLVASTAILVLHSREAAAGDLQKSPLDKGSTGERIGGHGE